MEQYVGLTQNKTAVVMVMVMKTVWLTDVIFTVYYHIRRVQYIRLCTDKDKEQTNNGTSGKQNRWLIEWTKDWTYIQTELMRCRWSEEENHRWAEKHKNHKKHKKLKWQEGWQISHFGELWIWYVHLKSHPAQRFIVFRWLLIWLGVRTFIFRISHRHSDESKRVKS